jgi:hypothetical protein
MTESSPRAKFRSSGRGKVAPKQITEGVDRRGQPANAPLTWLRALQYGRHGLCKCLTAPDGLVGERPRDLIGSGNGIGTSLINSPNQAVFVSPTDRSSGLRPQITKLKAVDVSHVLFGLFILRGCPAHSVRQWAGEMM